MAGLTRALSSQRVRRVLMWVCVLVCLGMIVWAGQASWQRPCRRAGEAVSFGASGCPSLALDLVALVVAFGLWAIALRMAQTGQVMPFVCFSIVACTLATGLLSSTGGDWEIRLFYVSLAWSAPAVFFLHHELLSRPPGRMGRILLWTLLGLASVWSLPQLLWTHGALVEKGWGPFWRNGTRLTVLLSIGASALFIGWQTRHQWGEARRRPVRLIAFGNIAAVMPLALLALLPNLLGLPKVPWELTFVGFLISPVFYAYALMPSRFAKMGTVLRHVSVYYVLLVLLSSAYLLGVMSLFRSSAGLRTQWPWVGIVFSIGCVLAAAPLTRHLERLTDWAWFGKGSTYSQRVGQLAESLAVTLDRDTLQRLLVHELAQTMRLSGSALFLVERNRGLLSLVGSTGLELSAAADSALPTDSRMAAYLATLRKPVTPEQVRTALPDTTLGEPGRWLLSLPNVALWLPLTAQEGLYGVLLIGSKLEDDLLTAEDQRILTSLAHQGGAAAHNVYLGEEKTALEAQYRQAQKMEAVGQLAAGIAHDFNNILTSMMGYAELLQEHEDMPKDALEDLRIIDEQGARAAHLIRQILDFSRKSLMQRQPLEVVSFLEEACKFLRRTIPESIHLRLEIDPDEYVVRSDPALMQQVLVNLAVNACDAMPEGGELRIGLARFSLQAGDRAPLPDMQVGEWVVLSVADSGVGIPDEVLPRIFEPFFTTKEVGKGTGLGLAQVYGIVMQHEGHITVETRVGAGTTFTIYLPALPVPEKAAGGATTEEVRKGHGETILVVEDEGPVLEVIRRMLEQANYRVLAVGDPREALEVYEQHRDEVALVVTDMVMPKMSGSELIQALRARDPRVRAVMVSGYPLGEGERKFLLEENIDWLQKPMVAAKLAQVVNLALA